MYRERAKTPEILYKYRALDINTLSILEIRVTAMKAKSRNSILEELADDPADEMQLRIKSKLMNAIIDYIDGRELTQSAAAEIMLVQRTRVNDVCNGRIDKMTIDALVAMAARLGLDPLQSAA